MLMMKITIKYYGQHFILFCCFKSWILSHSTNRPILTTSFHFFFFSTSPSVCVFHSLSLFKSCSVKKQKARWKNRITGAELRAAVCYSGVLLSGLFQRCIDCCLHNSLCYTTSLLIHLSSDKWIASFCWSIFWSLPVSIHPLYPEYGFLFCNSLELFAIMGPRSVQWVRMRPGFIT